MNRSYVVNSNISLHYIPMERLKTTAIGVYIHRPLNEEEASMNALLPYVLKRGCRLCKDTTEIAHYLENLYGASLSAGVLKKGEDQIIAFDAETISDSFAPNNEELLSELTKLLLSMIFEPLTENGAFSEEIVKREKKNAIDRIQGIINDKRTYAQLRCASEMCKGEPFSIYKSGSIEGIEKISPDGLYQYYQRMISESRIDVFVCGQADVEKIADSIKSVKIPFEKSEIPRCDILKKRDNVKEITEKMEVTQGKLSIGLTTGIDAKSEDFFSLIVANSIFGSGAHSKLFNNVREKLSLCYYAASRLEKYKGFMLIDAGIEFKNFKKAYDEILAQLEAIKNGDISDFEYESAISALTNSYQSVYDDPRALQSLYLGEIVADTQYSVADYIRKIKAVTKADVMKVANKLTLDTVYFLTGMEEQA